MQHDWVLDVLSDLTAFARENGLPELAEQLDDARHVASQEIAWTARTPVADLFAVVVDAEGVRNGV
ncbi:MAG: hypothetical protein AAF646_08995 [Pseudomonadota bacterium]